MFFNKKYKKIISIFLMTTLLAPSLLLTQPKKAEALASDVIGGPMQIINTIYSGISIGFDKLSSAASAALKNKELILDSIAWSAAKLAIKQITTSIVNWINSGFEGSPAFVTDFKGMMTNIADKIIGEWILNNDKLSFLCSPFTLEIKLALWNTFYKPDKPKCTLSDVINHAGGALKSLEDDFRWGTWLDMTSKSSNNVYGVYGDVKSIIVDEILTEQQQKQLQANWGEGFLPWEECENVPVEGDTTGAVYDTHCSTKTPGSVIESQLNHTLGLGEDSLVAADEINEIIGALLMQLVKSVMGEAGLLGQDPSSYSPKEELSVIVSDSTKVIDESLSFEREYSEIKNGSLDLVLEAKDLITKLTVCLTATHETEKLALVKQFLEGSSVIPQSNTQINLKELETQLRKEILTSDELILKLNNLITEINNDPTTATLSEVMRKYNLLIPEVVTLAEISDAKTEKDGYGKVVKGLPNGLTYDIGRLINIKATSYGDEFYIVPEKDKGIQQRLDECVLCRDSHTCTDSQ